MDSSSSGHGFNGATSPQVGGQVGATQQALAGSPHAANSNGPVLNRRPILGYNNGRTGQHQTIQQQHAVSSPHDAHHAVSGHPSETGKSARLIGGPNIKLKGVEISDCEALVVEGVVEATLRAKHVIVVESGLLAGKVVAQVAEIHGEFKGDLTVHERLVVHSTGRISGNVRYERLKIDEGAVLSGNIAPINEGENLELPLGT
jgi:cytoskeletal protein CcmA (bactofilin family)